MVGTGQQAKPSCIMRLHTASTDQSVHFAAPAPSPYQLHPEKQTLHHTPRGAVLGLAYPVEGNGSGDTLNYRKKEGCAWVKDTIPGAAPSVPVPSVGTDTTKHIKAPQGLPLAHGHSQPSLVQQCVLGDNSQLPERRLLRTQTLALGAGKSPCLQPDPCDSEAGWPEGQFPCRR